MPNQVPGWKLFVVMQAGGAMMAAQGNLAWANPRAEQLFKQALHESIAPETRHLAIKHLDEAIALDPSRALFWQSKADVLQKSDDSEKALPCITKSIELNNKVDYAFALQAQILNSMERCDAAIAAIDHAIKLSPNPAYVIIKAQIFTKQGRFDLAEKELDNVVKISSVEPLARSRRANVAIHTKHWQKAIDDLTWLIDKATVKNLVYYENLLRRVQAYTETKQFEKAIADCKKGMAGQPEARQFHAALVKVYEASGNTSEAKRARQVLDTFDDDLQPPKSDRFK
ncbi:MAG: hypothetical protein JSS83_26475 [Cyanobacteria bacterium SZAS LIN-3]|nr:hypothetical protein [Cyanobacteria bacterium SZAS LIN-3]